MSQTARLSPVGIMLHRLGRSGPLVLVLALAVGAVLRLEATRPLLIAAAFLLVLGSFLAASFAPRESTAGDARRLMPVFAWLLLGPPLLVVAGLGMMDVDVAIGGGLMLAVIAPPVGSAAAVATMLALRPRLALVLSISLTAVAPLTIPAHLTLLGVSGGADIARIAGTLFAMIGGAVLLAGLARRYRGPLLPILPDAHAASSISVIGLIIVGVTAASSMSRAYAADSAACRDLLLAATALNLAGCATGAAVFARLGRKDALTIGLVTGNRNVTLAWAIAHGAITPQAETFVTAAVIPILALPLIVKLAFLAAGSLRWPAVRSGGTIAPHTKGSH